MHPLVRPALLTAMLGYTFVALGVATDLGRFWAMWHVMLPPFWQPNSVLFEVAICVMCYLSVLYIEFLPAACERFIGRVNLPGPLAALNQPVDRAQGPSRVASDLVGRRQVARRRVHGLRTVPAVRLVPGPHHVSQRGPRPHKPRVSSGFFAQGQPDLISNRGIPAALGYAGQQVQHWHRRAGSSQV